MVECVFGSLGSLLLLGVVGWVSVRGEVVVRFRLVRVV